MGLSIISGFVSSRRLPILPITLMVIRAEESAWFAASYIGSRASFGQLSAQELETVIRAGDGEKLGDAIQAAGGCISEIAKGYSHWSPGDIALFLEPHIEQGPILQDEQKTIGVVDRHSWQSTVSPSNMSWNLCPFWRNASRGAP